MYMRILLESTVPELPGRSGEEVELAPTKEEFTITQSKFFPSSGLSLGCAEDLELQFTEVENCLVPTDGIAMLAAMKIAFIGIGRMGVGMARNLLRAGHTVAVYNRSREKAEALAADGARVANSPADACRESEVVMTMVADDPAVEEIVFGNDGIASA